MRVSGVFVCVGFGVSVRLCVSVCVRQCVLWVGGGTRTKPSVPSEPDTLSEAFFSVVMPLTNSPWIDASAEICRADQRQAEPSRVMRHGLFHRTTEEQWSAHLKAGNPRQPRRITL